MRPGNHDRQYPMAGQDRERSQQERFQNKTGREATANSAALRDSGRQRAGKDAQDKYRYREYPPPKFRPLAGRQTRRGTDRVAAHMSDKNLTQRQISHHVNKTGNPGKDHRDGKLTQHHTPFPEASRSPMGSRPEVAPTAPRFFGFLNFPGRSLD